MAWSLKKNKTVFLDFGFSKVLKEGIGSKTFTKFIGTYKFTSSEMKKSYVLQDSLFVDLYFNDICGLKLVYQIMKESIPSFAETK